MKINTNIKIYESMLNKIIDFSDLKKILFRFKKKCIEANYYYN